MKKTTTTLLYFLLAGCKTIGDQSCDAVIQDIHDKLNEDSINVLRATQKDDLIQFHHSWGMGIRNSYDLWSNNSSLRRSCAAKVGQQDMHPDDASMVIMEGVWDLEHKNP